MVEMQTTAEVAGVHEARRYPSPLVKQDLAKLGKDAESRRAALYSLRAVIEEHLQGPALPRFLHQVEDSPEGRRHAASIVSDLARFHGDRLSSHIPRLLQILAHTLLASAACPGLQSDCAKAIAAVAKHSSSSPASAEHVLRRLCLPLIALLPHKVELLSSGAAACLRALVESETWKFAAAPLVSKLCLRAAMALASRSAQTVAHMNLLRSLASSNASALAHFSIPLLRLLNQEILISPCASWQVRLASIQVMESLLRAAEQTSSLSPQLGITLQTLAKCRLDRMPLIRKAAVNAMRVADELTAKADMKQKQVEEIPQSFTYNSQTEPNSPLRQSLDCHGCNIEELFKTTALSSPRSQRSHALFVSPRVLADLGNTPPSAINKQSDSLTPPSEYSPGRAAATDDSDYFCAYFFDTKENVSCRKIVHHIHDTAPRAGSTPPSSPSKQRRKVTVPPLPISNAAQESRQTPKISASSSNGLAAISSSLTRHVPVQDSHARLLAACDQRVSISAENNVLQEPAAITDQQAKAEMGDQAELLSPAEERAFTSHRKPDATFDLELIRTENHMHTTEDLHGTISSSLIEIREVGEGDDEKYRYGNGSSTDQQQGSIMQETVGQDFSPCSPINADNPPKVQQEINQDLKTSVAAQAGLVENHGMQLEESSMAGKEEDAADTSSGEWSVRDNPIAEGQLCHRPAASQPQISGNDLKQYNGADGPGNNGSACPNTTGGAATKLHRTHGNMISAATPDQEESMAIQEEQWGEEEFFEEADNEALESCHESAGASESEDCEGEGRETEDAQLAEAAVVGRETLPKLVRSTPTSLRRFLMRSTACVIPGIAMVTLAKLFHSDLQLALLQYADPGDYFVPPT